MERRRARIKEARSETEGFLMAAQDGVCGTLVHRRAILKEEISSTNCRACGIRPETVMHLLSACPSYARSLYIKRHNAALRVLYFHLRHWYRIDAMPKLPYAPLEIEAGVENERGTIYWNHSFPTTRVLEATKPDIVLRERSEKVIYVIEFSCPAETNRVPKDREKRDKYRDLIIDVRHQYPGHQVKLVVLIVGALGGMKASFLRELFIIPAFGSIAKFLACKMQKAAILGSLHILRPWEVLVEILNTHSNIQSHEEEKENKTTAQTAKEENQDLSAQDIDESNLLTNKTIKVDSTTPLNSSQESNRTTLPDSSERNHRSRITNRTTNTTRIPIMSLERRNSYLSIAERRKYYNRTRTQTKKPQLNDIEPDYQGSTSSFVTSSTETLQVNEIRVVKKPLAKDSREVTIDKASNQRLFVNFPSNETQWKPLVTRQSVIQSQYQFGQKINLRKPVIRGQEAQEERLKRKKEKSKVESVIENNTNKLSRNYPTQSTKLTRVDENHWATTTTLTPQPDAVNENSVTHSTGNGTRLEKLLDSKTSDIKQRESFSEIVTAIPETENQNNTKVPQTKTVSPLLLENIKSTEEENLSAHEVNISTVIQNVYNQEILKLSNSTSTKEVGKSSAESDIKYKETADNSESHLSAETAFNASVRTKTLLKVFSNTTGKVNFMLSTMPPHVRSGKFSNFEGTRPTVLKSNLNESHQAPTIPLVKAIFKQPLNLTSKTRLSQNGTNVSKGTQKQIPLEENKEKSKNGSKAEEYPLTIELNENNKRVLSEMFQTLTTPKPKQVVKGESITSQRKIHDISKSSSLENTTIKFSTTKAFPTTGLSATTTAGIINTIRSISTEISEVLPPDDDQEDHKAQGTRYNTKFYISPKLNGSQVIKVVEEDDEDDDVDVQGRSAGVAVYVLAAFGLVPLLLALVFGAKFMIQRNQREYDCESDAKSDISANESQIKEGKKKKSSTDLKKSPSNVTTITLVAATRLPRVQHWENLEKQGNRNWELPRSKLKLKTILGQGNFGQVWKAEAEDMPGHEGVTRLVAVKTVKEGATEKEHTEFVKELEIMQQIGSHPNIVTLLGCCTDQEPYYLIMEYVKCGKLLTYLREHRINENYYNFSNNSDALTSRDLTVFAYCVARGMEYLASRGIIHRDLAARNVLVDHNKLCKIADFGMSRSVRDFENGQVYEERQQKGALPIRWMAPESLVYSVFTFKSDVWSFGILMWEIVTLGSTPYPNMGAREVMRKVRDGYRLERPSHCKPEFYRLISYCWANDPNKRPGFSELRHELGNLLDNPTKDGSYVDLDRFAIDNSFHVSTKTNDFRLLERNDFKTLQKIGDWNNKDWPEDIKKIRMKRGRNNGKGTVTLTGQGSFTVNSRILEKEFKII